MQETQEMGVGSLGWEDPSVEEMATHSVFLLGDGMDRGTWRVTVPSVTKSGT